MVQGRLSADRDRDASGRPRNARPRDRYGRPLPRGEGTAPPVDEPALPPAPALRRAQALLDEGRAFEAHEVLEAVWKGPGPVDRPLWRGLAQLCVGLTHAQRGNDVGARRLLTRAATTLREAAASPDGVDLETLVAWAREPGASIDVATMPRLVRGAPAQAADDRD